MMPHSPYKYHGDAYGQDFQYKMACVNTDRLASKLHAKWEYKHFSAHD